MARRRVVPVAGTPPAVVFGAGGLRSALDAAEVDQGRAGPATGVFQATLAGRRLSFHPVAGGLFVDDQTRTTWNILGEAMAGPQHGRHLVAVAHIDTFWFAWAAFQPTTRLLP